MARRVMVWAYWKKLLYWRAGAGTGRECRFGRNNHRQWSLRLERFWSSCARGRGRNGICGTLPGKHLCGEQAYKPGGGSWSVASDQRLKHSIRTMSGALTQLLQLRGVTYEYTDPASIGELPGVHTGMVAQEVERVFPSWIDTGADGYKRRLTFRGFEAVAVEAIRELQEDTNKSVSALESKIEKLEKQNEELRAALVAITELLNKKGTPK